MSKDLLKWQLISLISRFFAVGVGIVQSVILTRWILSVEEFGLIGIISAVGASLGVYQHLGLASGTTRELAVRDQKDASKVFISSLIARYAVSIPLAIGLFLFSSSIAIGYKHPEMTLPLQIYAVILLLQASQDVGGAVLQGLQRFKHLFLFQSFLAVLSICLYVPLSFFFKFNGYFLALTLVTLVSVVVMWFLALRSITGGIKWPSRADFVPILKDIFSVGISIYIVKIIFTNWKNLGTIFLGTQVSLVEVGFFSYALGYALKLMTVSDALTDVNLSVMSKLYKEERHRFEEVFMHNFSKVYAFVWVAALSAIFWAPQIFYLFVKHKYDFALPYVSLLVMAIWAYSYINYLGASIIVPAKEMRQMVIYYLVMLGGTALLYFGLKGVFSDQVYLMSLAMCGGALASLVYQVLVVRFKVNFWVFDWPIILVTLTLLPLLWPGFLGMGLIIKLGVFIVCLTVFLFILLRFKVVTIPARLLSFRSKR